MFSSKFRHRLNFEKLNYTDEYARSFNLEEIKADFSFEVSSEGEFQQVRSLVEKCLEFGKKVEIIYCSESLERNMDLFKLKYSTQNLRVLRLPLTSISFFNMDTWAYYWLSSPKLILCRYDFFPELIFYGCFKAESFVLVAATLKNFKKNLWTSLVYKKFNLILTTTDADKTKFMQFFQVKPENLIEHDFRVLQISERITHYEKNLAHKLENFKELKSIIESVDKNKRIILGSYWPSEFELFNNKDFAAGIQKGDYIVFLLPHILGAKSCEEIEKGIQSYSDIPVHIFHGHSGEHFCEKFRVNPGIVIIDEKNILVELYKYFAHAFVGGGHGRSVHSLLEPYLAGCHLYCGPKVHRSTEYDVASAKTPEQICIIENLPTFFDEILKRIELEFSTEIRNDYVKSTQNEFTKILKTLEVKL